MNINVLTSRKLKHLIQINKIKIDEQCRVCIILVPFYKNVTERRDLVQ
jgi:hypothetical protein